MDDTSLLSVLRDTFKPQPPRQSPHIEAMAERVLAALQQGGDRAGALQSVGAVRERLGAARADAEAASEQDLTETQRAIVERMLRAYAENDLALQGLIQAVEASDRPAAEAALKRIREATAELYRCSDDLQHRVDADAADSQGGLVTVPPQYGAVHEACDRVARGDIGVLEWETVLISLETEVAQALHTIHEGFEGMGRPLREDAEAARLAEEVEGGFQDSLVAIGRMQGYREDQDVQHLNAGWTDLMTATRRIQRAMRSLTSTGGLSADEVELDADE